MLESFILTTAGAIEKGRGEASGVFYHTRVSGKCERGIINQGYLLIMAHKLH